MNMPNFSPLDPTAAAPPLRLTLSRDEGAAAIGICVRKFDDLVKAGEIKVARIGTRVLIPAANLQDYLDRLSGRTLTPAEGMVGDAE